jgi:Ca-activated chloride channel family protein
MRFGANYVLGSGVRIVAIAVALSASTLFAQSIPPAQSSPSTSPTSPSATTAGQNPQSVRARTAQPIPSAQEQAGQTSTEQQPAQDRQEPIKPESSVDDPGRFVFKKQVQEVVLHATVVDETGQLVTTLDRSAFSVYQNNQPEPITSFRREDVPVAMGIVIDNSGSMRDKREKVNHAVLNLIRASNPQDEIFVVNFSQNSYLDQDFTSDVNLLQAALHQVSTRGSTCSLRRRRGLRRPLTKQSSPGQESPAGRHRRTGQHEPGNATGSHSPVAAKQGPDGIRNRTNG